MVTGDVPFHLDPKSGEIKTSTRLDYESQVSFLVPKMIKPILTPLFESSRSMTLSSWRKVTMDSSKAVAVWQSKWRTRMTRNHGQVAHSHWRIAWTSRRGREGFFLSTFELLNSNSIYSVNFTDLDSSTQDLSVKEDRTDSSSQWNGLKLIPTFIASREYYIEKSDEIFK